MGWSSGFTPHPTPAVQDRARPIRGLRPPLASRLRSDAPRNHPVDSHPAPASAPPSPASPGRRCQSRAESSPPARFGKSERRAPLKARAAHPPEGVRHTAARAARGHGAEAAARVNVAARHSGHSAVTVSMSAITRLRSHGRPDHLRGEQPPPQVPTAPLAISRLGDRLAGSLRASESPLPSDVLQGAPTLIA